MSYLRRVPRVRAFTLAIYLAIVFAIVPLFQGGHISLHYYDDVYSSSKASFSFLPQVVVVNNNNDAAGVAIIRKYQDDDDDDGIVNATTTTATTGRRSNHNNMQIQWVHRKCHNRSEGASIEGSSILRYTQDEDRPDAWWTIECTEWENWTKIVEYSLHRRIKKWLNSSSSLPVVDQATITPSMTQQLLKQQNNNSSLANDILGDWRIYIIDYKDTPSITQLEEKLLSLSNVVGWQRVYLITRTDIEGRKLNKPKNQNEMFKPFALGHYHNWSNVIGVKCAGVKKFHFAVRDDVAEAVENELLQQIIIRMRSTTEDSTTDYAISALPRPVDVAHWWRPTDTRQARLRSTVSQHLLSMKEKYANLNITADIVGSRGREGRQGVHTDYVNALLGTKIIIVAQRDRWEDHYRLFEALLSGALVMSDRMLSFPWGVNESTTIVVYNNLQDLETKILYYLDHPEERYTIAKAGRELALNHHRQHHRWEDLLLGNWSDRNEYGVSYNRP